MRLYLSGTKSNELYNNIPVKYIFFQVSLTPLWWLHNSENSMYSMRI